MKLLLLFAVLLVAVSASSMDSHCQWGASYWCQSYDTAVKCGQLKYCRTEVWEKKESINDALLLHGAPLSSWKSYKNLYKPPTPPPTSGGECDVCMILMSYVAKAEKGANKTQVKTDLEKLCNRFKSTQCYNFVKDDFDTIWSIIEQDSDPKAVCTFIKICTPTTTTTTTKRSVQRLSKPSVTSNNVFSSIECDICEYFAKYVVDAMKNTANEAKAKTAAEDICKMMTPVSTECETFVEKNFDRIWKMMQAGATSPQQLCSEIFPNKCSTVKALRYRRGIIKDLECKVCKSILPRLISKVKNEDVAGKIMSLVDRYCDRLPSDEKNECKVFMNAIITVVVNDIFNATIENTDLLCKELGYCDKSSQTATVQRHSAKKRSVKVDICEICKEIFSAINSSSTEALAKAAVEELCDAIPQPGGLLCKVVVEKYFDDMWDFIEKKVGNGTQFCKKIDLCSSATKGETKILVNVHDLDSDVECSVCKLVVGYIDTLVDKNSTKEEAKEALENFCSVLKPVESECKDIVDENFDSIWALLVNNTDPDTICTTLLKLCTSSTRQLLPTVPQSKSVTDPECDLCKVVVGYVASLLKENKTETQVKDELEKLCSYFGNVESECKSLIDTYFDTIWKMIVSEAADPATLCSELKLCTSSVKKSLPVTPQLKSVSDTACDICKALVGYVDKFLKQNATEQEAKDEVEMVCNYLGPLGSTCKELIDQYFDDIWTLLVNEADPDTVCTTLGLCSSSRRKPFLTVPQLKSDDECAVCKVAVSTIEGLLKENKTETEIEDQVKMVCSYLGSVASECKELIDKYFPEIYNLILKNANATEICTLLGVCSKTSRTLPTTVPQFKGSTECDVCELLVVVFQKEIISNKSEEEVELELEKACNSTGNMKYECKTIVKSYLPLIFELIKETLTPEEICTKIGLCSASARPTVLLKQKMQSKVKRATVKEDLCDVCKKVATTIDNFIKKNGTEEEAKKELEQICSDIPDPIGSECNDLVDQYFPVIWILLKETLHNSTQACELIQLCPGKLTRPPVKRPQLRVQMQSKVKMATVKEDLCDVCKRVGMTLEKYMKENGSEEDAKKELERVCSDFPDPVDTDCKDFVDQYVPLVWTLLKETLRNSTQACELIQLCPEMSTRPPVKGPQLRVQGTITCTLCGLVIKELESLIERNSTEAQIEQALEKVCAELPSSISGECKSLVEQYGPQIINAIISGLDPKEVCTAIGLCSSSSLDVSVLASTGGDETDCQACEEVINALKKILPYTTKLDTDVLEKACQLLPSSIRTECVDLVKTYGPDLIKLLDDTISAQAICKRICK